MMLSTTTALEELARQDGELARWVYARFRRSLSFEEAADAAQEAFAQAARRHEEFASKARGEVELWLRRAAHHCAIDLLRRRHGEGAERREFVALDAFSDGGDADDATAGAARAALAQLSSGDDTVEPLLEDFDEDHNQTVVREAIERLGDTERRALQLRHFDNLPVPACAELLGLHRKKFERVHTRAVKQLRDVIAVRKAGPACDEVRLLLDFGREQRLAPTLVATRDAHLEGCLHCRIYQRKALAVIFALPLPGAGAWDRIIARGAQLLGGGGSAAGAASAAHGGAVSAQGAGAGAGLLGGVAAKTTAVAAAGAIAAGGIGAAVKQQGPTEPASAAAPAPRAAQQRPAAPSGVAAASKPTAKTIRKRTTKATSGAQAPKAKRASTAPTPKRQPARKPEASGSTSSSSTLNSASSTSSPAPSDTASPSSTSTGAGTSGAGTGAPAPQPVAAPASADTDTFSGEFTP